MKKQTRISIVLGLSLLIAGGAGVATATQTQQIQDVLQVEAVKPVAKNDLTEAAMAGVRKADKPTSEKITNLQKSKTWVGHKKAAYFELPNFGKKNDVKSAQDADDLSKSGTYTQTYAITKPKIFITDTKIDANSKIASSMNQNVMSLAQQTLGNVPALTDLNQKQINKNMVIVTGYSDAEDKQQGTVKEFISFIFMRDAHGHMHMISIESEQDSESVAKNIATTSTLGNSLTVEKPSGVAFKKNVEK